MLEDVGKHKILGEFNNNAYLGNLDTDGNTWLKYRSNLQLRLEFPGIVLVVIRMTSGRPVHYH